VLADDGRIHVCSGPGDLTRKQAERAKNMFALGLMSWLYGRPTESTITFLQKRFAKVPDIRDANVTAYRAGWNISLGAIVSNSGAALLLIPVGLLFFQERVSAVNVLGVVVCVAGLVLVNLR